MSRCRLFQSAPLYRCMVAIFIAALPLAGNAQSRTGSAGVVTTLPEAPAAPSNTTTVSASSTEDTSGSAIISGVVVDPSNAAIVDARVTLLDAAGHTIRTTQSGPDGAFRFDSLPAGGFQILVKATGFASSTSATITLADKQAYVSPNILLNVANATTEVEVSGDDRVIAAAQVKAEEKQRVLGVIPNFYTSYIPNAVPLSAKQKYTFAIRDTFDPVGFVGTAIGAGIEQANDSFKGYGQGAAGYGKRYAALYGDGLTSDILSHAVFPALFHQDPRYFYQGTGTFKSRLFHAISFSVVARSDSGKTMPNYSYLLGDIGSGALSNLYYPHADRGAGLVFSNAAIGIAGRAAGSIIQEFLLPHLTTNHAGKVKP
jgi:hypothetical protein